MTQYTIKVLYPDPPAEEALIGKAARAHFWARRLAQEAETSGIENLLLPRDLPVLQELLSKAGHRQILSPESCDAITRLAASCAARIADLSNPDAPETRRRAMLLHEMDDELRALAGLVGEVLDLQAAIGMRHRIRETSSRRSV